MDEDYEKCYRFTTHQIQQQQQQQQQEQQQQEQEQEEQAEFDQQNVLNEYYYKHDNDDFIDQINTSNIMFSNNNNYIFAPQQANVMIPNDDSMLTSFQQSDSNLALRKEQDVFCELISLATKNNQQPLFQYAPPSFSTEFPINVQDQIQEQHKNYLAKLAATTAIAGPSNHDRYLFHIKNYIRFLISFVLEYINSQ